MSCLWEYKVVLLLHSIPLPSICLSQSAYYREAYVSIFIVSLHTIIVKLRNQGIP